MPIALTSGKPDPNGDPDMVDQIVFWLANMGVPHDHVSCVYVNANAGAEERKWGSIGGFGNTEMYEICSMSKAMMGHVFADCITRNECTAETLIGSLIPTLPYPVSQVALKYFATHTSGLPSYDQTGGEADHWANYVATGEDPYSTFTLSTLLSHVANNYSPENLGNYVYSNMGASVLGHALATAAGYPTYQALITARLFTPLGMSRTYVPIGAAELRADTLLGHLPSGSHIPSWTWGSYYPCAGVRCCLFDIAKITRAVLTSTAIGMNATADHTTGNNTGTGWLWGRSIINGDLRLAHGGLDAGFSSLWALNMTKKKGLALFNDTNDSTGNLAYVGYGILDHYGGGS